ncbi:MAG: hypothetical protein OXU77_19775 [Gammaproteobacteria bacterium]|nr:hypothetical protein [Gammaproteobacteria bacterium]
MPQFPWGHFPIEIRLKSAGKQLLRAAVERSGFRHAVGSEGAFKLTFSTLLIVAALGFTYTGSDGDFPRAEMHRVLLHVLAVTGVLLFGALVLPWGRTISDAALALATLAALFTVYVVHTELFEPANRVWMILVLAAALFALFTAFRVIGNLRFGGFVLTAAAASGVVAAGCPEVGPKLLAGMREPGGLLYVGSPVMWTVLVLAGAGFALVLYVLSRRGVRCFRSGGLALLATASFLATLFLVFRFAFGEGSSGHYSDGWEDHPNVRSVTFKETPNLYFVGFDSITPEAVMGKHMGIDTTDFHRLMHSEMRRFRNLFANAVPTKHSLNTMMALDQDIYLEEYESVGWPSYFAGHDLSPLIWLLGQNGYRTTSIYENTYFGHANGPHIDSYSVHQKSALCSLLDEGIRLLAFGGYCWNWQSERLTAADFLVRRLSDVDRSTPQFVVAHLNLPGHTPKVFDYESQEDRKRFVSIFEDRFNRAAIVLEQIIEHLSTNDPNSILFVFGDHGAWLSRGYDFEDDPAFVLQDRFGILGGVYPRDRCAQQFDEAEQKGYVTSLDVVHAIFRCLSDGQSPLLKPRRDRFWTDDLPEHHSYRYKEFLYE